jgi:hypothetical protein
LPFSPAALFAPLAPPDPGDPAVAPLLRELAGSRLPADAARTALASWRELAATDAERLFGRGLPPDLVTVSVRRGRRGWTLVGVTRGRALRATRNGIRASSWRPDPDLTAGPGDRRLAILVTEQQRSAGRYATGRLLTPDLHMGEEELTLTVYVEPVPVVGIAGANPETPVWVELPEPIGERILRDGSLWEPRSGARPPVERGASE